MRVNTQFIVGSSHDKFNNFSVVLPKAIRGSKKDHKLGPPRHPGTDHPKEIPKVPVILDRITCQHTPGAFHQDTPDKHQPIWDPAP